MPLAKARQYHSITWYRVHNGFMMMLSDGACISLGLVIAGAIQFFLWQEELLPQWGWYLFPLWWGGAVLMRIVPSWGLGPVEELRRMTILQFFVFTTTAIALLVSKAELENLLTLAIAFVFSSVLIPFARIRLKRLLIGAKLWGVPVVVYGVGETAREVIRMLHAERGLGYSPIVVVDETPALAPSAIEGVPVEGTAELGRTVAPVAIVAMPGMSRERLIELLEGGLSRFLKVMVIPELFEVPSLWVKPRDLNGVLGLEITSNLLSPFARFTKRSIDIALVLLCAWVWVPLCVLIALLIWIVDRANPIFVQERIGYRGSQFKTWKFRTMVADAEEVLRKKLAEDGVLREEWKRSYKLKEDPRVTLLGRFLRRLSLDEIPQVVNVLRGDMSLVGPRPLPAYHHSGLSPRVRDLRERVRPGLTGLWQVSGRSDKTGKDMERLDTYYVRNWSPWLDMVVLVRTFRAVSQGRGAY